MYTHNRFLLFLVVLCSPLASSAQTQPTEPDFQSSYDAYVLLSSKNNWNGSLEYAAKAYETGKILFPDNRRLLSQLTFNYGQNLFKTLRHNEAQDLLSEALNLYELEFGIDAAELIPVLKELGNVTANTGGEYLKYFDRALAITETFHGADSLDYGILAAQVGTLAYVDGRPHKAKDYIYKGLDILSVKLDASDLRLVQTTAYAGATDFYTGQIDSSIVRLEKVLPMLDNPQEPPTPLEISLHDILAQAYYSTDEMELANQHLAAIGKPPYPLPEPAIKFQNMVFPWPPVLIRREIGLVRVKYDIDEKGRVQNVSVPLLVGNPKLADATINVIKKWRYEPLLIDGKRVSYTGMQLTFIFPMPESPHTKKMRCKNSKCFVGESLFMILSSNIMI